MTLPSVLPPQYVASRCRAFAIVLLVRRCDGCDVRDFLPFPQDSTASRRQFVLVKVLRVIIGTAARYSEA